MNIKTWRERHKPGIRAATDPTIAELMQAEIDELRAALKAQPVQPALTDSINFPMYRAVNELMSEIGHKGEVDSNSIFVEKVMDELYELDGGNVAQRVEDLCEESGVPRYPGTCMAVSEYIGEDQPVQPEPDPQLCKFYQVETFPALVEAMERHIEKLQAKMPNTTGTFKVQKVRQG